MRQKQIPFYRTPVTSRQTAAVARTLRSGWLTTGAACRRLERSVAEYLGVKYAVGVNSCTAGLHLALKVTGVGPGDEVITTPFTFIASVESIVHSGATPVFADIDPDSFNLSPEEAARKITERTRAIMPVHIAGLPCELTPLSKLARAHKLRLVHDAAHAVGAEYRGRRIGAIPDITSFSFYATKNITTGEGGMVTTSNKRWAETLRVLSLHGMDRQAWKRYQQAGSWYYEIKALGYKYNLADLNASVGLAQFEEFGKMQRQRARAAQWYDRLLEEIDEVEVPPRNNHSLHAWHLYIIRVDPKRLSIHRDEIIRELVRAGVGCGVHFIPVFVHPYYRKRYGLRSRDFPNTRDLYERVITLPFFPGIRKAEVTEVVRRLKKIIRKHKRR
jgi:dTDP-4-amino-4,6-dideoxygalactose transaminase